MSDDTLFEQYLEPFWLQAWLPGPDGFGGVKWGWADGLKFDGVFVQSTSPEIRVAEAQGLAIQGDFVTSIRMELEPQQDIVRRERDNMYFRITGMPVKSPEPAVSKFQRVAAERTEKPI